jgi:hypothetical protein
MGITGKQLVFNGPFEEAPDLADSVFYRRTAQVCLNHLSPYRLERHWTEFCGDGFSVEMLEWSERLTNVGDFASGLSVALIVLESELPVLVDQFRHRQIGAISARPSETAMIG